MELGVFSYVLSLSSFQLSLLSDLLAKRKAGSLAGVEKQLLAHLLEKLAT